MTQDHDTSSNSRAGRGDRDAELVEMEARKDAAYLERNQVVAALAKAFPSGVARTAIEGWSEDWHGCVYIDLPTGQASWHYHDSQAYLFNGIPHYLGAWDGHDTPEKYRRLAALATRQPAPEAAAVKVDRKDANDYCRILSILGMEEDGDPVAEVRRLFDLAATRQPVAPELAADFLMPEDAWNSYAVVSGLLRDGAAATDPKTAYGLLQAEIDDLRAALAAKTVPQESA